MKLEPTLRPGALEPLEATVKEIRETALQLMLPGGSRENTALVGKLMMHYPKQFSADGLTGVGLEQMLAIKRQVMGDWAKDLAEYPLWVVDKACEQWRRCPEGRFRPSIAAIREICDGLIFPIISAERTARAEYEAARRQAAFDAECRRQADERLSLRRKVGTA